MSRLLDQTCTVCSRRLWAITLTVPPYAVIICGRCDRPPKTPESVPARTGITNGYTPTPPRRIPEVVVPWYSQTWFIAMVLLSIAVGVFLTIAGGH